MLTLEADDQLLVQFDADELIVERARSRSSAWREAEMVETEALVGGKPNCVVKAFAKAVCEAEVDVNADIGAADELIPPKM